MSDPSSPHSQPPRSQRSRGLRALVFLLANALSLSRLALGLVFYWIPPEFWVPTVLYAALSDMFDGALSRRFSATSVVGQMLDPIADKVFVLAVLVAVLAHGLISLPALLLVGTRDIVVLGICLWVAFRRRFSDFARMRPTWSGKVATAGQFVFLGVLLWWRQFEPWSWTLVVVLSVVAAADYLWRFLRELRRP